MSTTVRLTMAQALVKFLMAQKTIVDGREAVQFLVRIKQLVEDPARLLLGV